MKPIRTLLSACLLFIFAQVSFAQKAYQLRSPDGKLNVYINTDKQLSWSVSHESTLVVNSSELGLELADGKTLGANASVSSSKTTSVDQWFNTPFYKKDKVHDAYNQLALTFKGNYGLIVRAYNDGVAYRFVTSMKGDITITNEKAGFNFANDDMAWLPFVNDYRHKDKFNTSFESLYDHLKISQVKKDTLAFLPALVDLGSGKKAAILEADLQDYPGMYLTGDGSTNLHAVFAPYPTKEERNNINYVVDERANYIAKTKGTRSFPWRVVLVSAQDKDLANNDMVQKLSEPSRIADESWIKPGKVAWDWWNDWNVTHVDFKAGINVETYKYYIDFAAANKLEYVIMDEGWSDDNDLNQTKIDVKAIVDYGKQKNVGIILWSTWFGITRNADALLAKYAQMGVKGFKIDFIDRDDQKMVSSLYELAGKAAANHLLVDYHGMYKPSGLLRTYPNVINCEGVKGLENVKWGGGLGTHHPEYDVTIPYIRMLAGPMDYTPGAMRNATKDAWRAVNSDPISQGTRCHQLAMYTIFEAPLQMLADNPTAYMREQECTDFIASIPTTFDETVALDGSVGEYVALARRKGTTWYLGAMTNWNKRELNLDLSFLGSGNYKITLFADGVNAGRDATDYTKNVTNVTGSMKMTVKLASGGGWAARIEKLP